MTPRRRWCTLTDTFAVMDVHRLLSSAMKSTDDGDWVFHFLMLSFHDSRDLPLRRQSSIVANNQVFGSVSCQQPDPRITCYAWRLTVRTPDVQRGQWPIAVSIRLFCALGMIRQASSCIICFSEAWIRLSRSTAYVQLSHSKSCIDKTRDLSSLNFGANLMFHRVQQA